jgi:sarcosine oxidase subunit gamma
MRHASTISGRTIFRIAPERLWFAAQVDDEVFSQSNLVSLGGEAIVTEMQHSRTVLRISGSGTETLLNRGLPIDLDASVFAAGNFVQSDIHHIPVLVHKLEGAEVTVFDVYVPRDLAESFWEWLVETAAPLGCEICRTT